MSETSQARAAPHNVADDRPEFLAVLGLNPPVTVEDVKQAYLAKVKTAHPDVGGDPADFLKIQEAFERATEWAKFRASRMAWLGNWVEKYVEQESFVEDIRRRGGIVHVENVDWLRRSFGDDFSQVAEKLTGIELHGPKFDDAALAWLQSHKNSLTGMKTLDLSGTAVTDAGIAHLAAFGSLHRLDLSGTQVTGAGLAVLDHLPKLKWLGLTGTPVSRLARLMLKFKHRALQVAA